MDFTPIVRPFFNHVAHRTADWSERTAEIQLEQLRSLLTRAKDTEFGREHGFRDILSATDLYKAFSSQTDCRDYEDIRELTMRMINGEKNILWPGRCRNYAQSSGTSGGRSKYIPITLDSLYKCHYRGARDCVAFYLANNPKSKIFSGKAFVLGGSFAHSLQVEDPKVKIGDLSATLIRRINPLANAFRVPDMKTALLPDWNDKLPALVEASAYADITNLSGVPSWFLTVIKNVIKKRGAARISDVWPNLEVFFHGGISFEPYREIYSNLTDPRKMHFVETYNASEGFFAVQNNPDDHAMILLIDHDIFYEFQDIENPDSLPIPIWEIKPKKIYELLITSSNGLWRYRLGDTVRIESTEPVKITIAGRTKTFINAFGEELMEDNAEKAIAAACQATGSSIRNYTAAPVYATDRNKGHHQWLIEWIHAPADIQAFAMALDKELRKRNSDYDAKRSHTIFLDPPEIVSLPDGSFNHWLSSVGTGKLGGQRKVPRLSNDRTIADAILQKSK